MQALARDADQVAFWREHTRSGIALCAVLPVLVLVRTLMSPPSPQGAVLVPLMLAVLLVLAPAIATVPVERVVRHPAGRFFYYAWEGLGIVLVTVVSAIDGGPGSPYVLFFYVVLAHAALAYPPVGVALAGVGALASYLGLAAWAGTVPVADVVLGAATLAVATATCALASANHVRVYRRTAAYAREVALLADRDGLTGCLNHRAFHDALQRAAGEASATRPLGLMVLDVDDFKSINDVHGHPAGDAVLQVIGRELAAVGPAGSVAGRQGGDEFALLVPGATARDVEEVAARLVGRLSALAPTTDVAVSIGVAATGSSSDGMALLADADAAAYRAKRARKARAEGVVPDRT